MKKTKIVILAILMIFGIAEISSACTRNEPTCNNLDVAVNNGNHVEVKPEMNNGINFQPQGQEQSSVNNLIGGSPTATGGAGGTGIGISKSTSSSTLEYHEVRQYPVPGEVSLPGILQTPNNDTAGPLVYRMNEITYIKYIYTLKELKDMAKGYDPKLKGGLLQKKILPKKQWSKTIAFYLEIPPNYSKYDFTQIGMIEADSDAKKIPSTALFGHAGLETAMRGGDSVFATGDGYQREDKNFSIGPGASYTGASGNGIATVSIAFVYAVRWKTDYPWIHFTATIAPTKK